MISKFYANKYCCEDISNIKNYELAINDKSMWVCHHLLEIRPFFTLSKKELINLDLYFKRPSKELVFLPLSKHRVLHTKGRKLTKEQVEDLRLRLIGRIVSPETREKLSKAAEWQKKIY